MTFDCAYAPIFGATMFLFVVNARRCPPFAIIHTPSCAAEREGRSNYVRARNLSRACVCAPARAINQSGDGGRGWRVGAYVHACVRARSKRRSRAQRLGA